MENPQTYFSPLVSTGRFFSSFLTFEGLLLLAICSVSILDGKKKNSVPPYFQ